MTTPKLPARKTVKLRFFVFYIFSVLLVVILFASFTKGKTVTLEKGGAATTSTQTIVAADERLHQQMEKLETVRAAYAGKETSKAALDSIQAEKTALLEVVDSIRKATASLPDAAEKAKIETLLSTFSRSAENGVVVLKSTGNNATDTTRAALEELKGILVQKEQRILELEKAAQGGSTSTSLLQEKDKTIADLQNKVTLLQAGSRTDASAGEWKEKYQRLKETADRNVAEANAIKASYKEVVEDNKRLASQIQSLRSRNQ